MAAPLLALGIFFSWAFLASASLERGAPFSFSFDYFGKKNRSFGPEIGLYGDAEAGDSAIRVTRPAVASSGRVAFKNPIRFWGTKPGFSTCFAFSVSPGNGGAGLAFFVTSSRVRMEEADELRLGLPLSVVAVEFVALNGPKSENLSRIEVIISVGNHIAIKSSDLLISNLVHSNGEKLHSWIDYNGITNRLEVRLGMSGVLRPRNSLVTYPVDLSSILWREEMLVGLSSASGNSTQNATTLYSWAFSVKHGLPYLMHSEPLDPDSFLVRPHAAPPAHVQRDYPWGLLMALVFAAALGAMLTLFTLFIWFAVVAHHPIPPVEYPAHPAEVVYGKIVLVGVKDVAASAK